jgi:DNA-binding CsgD family transcriptional regulator/predicted transcriptional regulator
VWETVGIPEAEALVYEALIPQTNSTVDVLSSRTNLTTAKTARALAALVRRGMAIRLPGRPTRYSAVEPSLAGSVLISKREHELRQLQQHLNKLNEAFHTESSALRTGEYIEVIEGTPKIWRAFVRVQRSAQTRIRAFDKPPYFVVAGKHADEGPNFEEREFLSSKTVGYRVVYDQESVATPGRLENIWEGINLGEQARVGASLPAKLVIRDDTLAIVSSTADYHNEIAHLIHPSSLLDLVCGLFETVWDRAIPLNRSEPGRGQPAAALSNRDRQLLGLLASGATDAAIARTFGWSTRTVQRHVQQLMTRVGARTRFQIGMESARRGWI